MEKVENEILELEKNAAKLEDMLRFNSEDSNWKKVMVRIKERVRNFNLGRRSYG